MKKIEIGNRYGKLVSTRLIEGRRWECVCDCGNRRIVRGDHLTAGRTKSCGCITRTQNGLSNHKLYSVWIHMHGRCYDTKNNRFYTYGARGIQVCARWFTFSNFLSDMGERPTDCTIDRIDPDGHYMPSNCRWSTMQQQQNNRRSNRRIEVNGVSRTFAEWERNQGLNTGIISRRIRDGWSELDAIFKPPRHSRSYSIWLDTRDRIEDARKLEQQAWAAQEQLQRETDDK